MTVAQGARGRASYLSEVYFVKNNLVGVTNAPESGDEGQDGDDEEGDPVIVLRDSLWALVGGLDELVELNIGGGAIFVLATSYATLAQGALGGCCSHDGRWWSVSKVGLRRQEKC